MSTIWLSVAVATPWLAALAIALLPPRWRQMARAITLGAMVVTGLVLAEASWIARSGSQAIGSVSALWRLDEDEDAVCVLSSGVKGCLP